MNNMSAMDAQINISANEIDLGKIDTVAIRKEKKISDEDSEGRQLRTREKWGAKPPIKALLPMEKPVHNVVITYTRTDPCQGVEDCDLVVKNLQDKFQQLQGLPDLPYNFLVSKDGLIYEGRGWDYRPYVPRKSFPHMRGTRIVIAQINREFDESLLSPVDSATWDLLRHGVDNNFIHPTAIKQVVDPWIY